MIVPCSSCSPCCQCSIFPNSGRVCCCCASMLPMFALLLRFAMNSYFLCISVSSGRQAGIVVVLASMLTVFAILFLFALHSCSPCWGFLLCCRACLCWQCLLDVSICYALVSPVLAMLVVVLGSMLTMSAILFLFAMPSCSLSCRACSAPVLDVFPLLAILVLLAMPPCMLVYISCCQC